MCFTVVFLNEFTVVWHRYGRQPLKTAFSFYSDIKPIPTEPRFFKLMLESIHKTLFLIFHLCIDNTDKQYEHSKKSQHVKCTTVINKLVEVDSHPILAVTDLISIYS